MTSRDSHNSVALKTNYHYTKTQYKRMDFSIDPIRRLNMMGGALTSDEVEIIMSLLRKFKYTENIDRVFSIIDKMDTNGRNDYLSKLADKIRIYEKTLKPSQLNTGWWYKMQKYDKQYNVDIFNVLMQKSTIIPMYLSEDRIIDMITDEKNHQHKQLMIDSLLKIHSEIASHLKGKLSGNKHFIDKYNKVQLFIDNHFNRPPPYQPETKSIPHPPYQPETKSMSEQQICDIAMNNYLGKEGKKYQYFTYNDTNYMVCVHNSSNASDTSYDRAMNNSFTKPTIIYSSKPLGPTPYLWASSNPQHENTESWIKFCLTTGLGLERLVLKESPIYLICVKMTKKILKIDTVDELESFGDTYGFRKNEDIVSIQWMDVALDYDGISMMNYNLIRESPHHIWYRDWDCDSIVIWNNHDEYIVRDRSRLLTDEEKESMYNFEMDD